MKRHGIHPDHVPALLPAPGDDGLPNPAVWRTRWHLAIALHMLLTHVHDGPTSSARACHAFGATDTDTSLLLDGIRLGRGIHDLDAARLTDAVDALVDAGLVDYQRRRDTLRPLTRLPRLPIASARLPDIDGQLDADIAYAMMGINAVKGVEIGAGFACVAQKGTEHGDEMTPEGFLSNQAGGILGGISTGQDIVVHVAIKPTSSIRLARRSIDKAGNPVTVETFGRHDPCVGIRATPIAEAMLAIILMDHALRHRGQNADDGDLLQDG